ncbi:methylmalonyl-CoA mutase family protein [Riemerella columbina]|uniref:methylmalonyl-CoA mutase family protein n=1 Tax=Riemerella columbina TaxID=103810 RepID=UPI00266ECC58|nr:methylmalonyl-CoA mutase family protein [Riemerella columbina]WKS94578.1 methylmalonyl-CoA mutase family protein [Riemerella columbina]
MKGNTTMADWEALVKQQLKTEDIDTILRRENLEDIEVKPYYHASHRDFNLLPKVEESPHLVALYQENLEEDAYAFLIKGPIVTADKTLFFEDYSTFEAMSATTENKLMSLVDIFDEKGNMNLNWGENLLKSPIPRALGVDVALYQNAGASIIQQLAIALAKAKDLIEIFGASVLERLIFKVAVGRQYFFEIAKIRALKLLFNQLSRAYQQNNIPYIFAETSLRNKTKADPENNLIRSTLELSAGMIGGADAVFARDFKVENSTPWSQEIAFKQSIVLAYESIINVFEDAAYGSYFVEDMTQQLATKAWQLFIEIEEKGSYQAMYRAGEIQKMVYQHAVKEQSWIEQGKIKLVGANLYPSLDITKDKAHLYREDRLVPVRLSEIYE